MGRSILAVIVGMVVWAVLWMGSNQVFFLIFPDLMDLEGPIDNAGVLLTFLLISVLLSVIAGYITAWIARRRPLTHALVLGIIQLTIGIIMQVQFWELMPVWYHLSFLALLIPGYLVGAMLRSTKMRPPQPVEEVQVG
jgi:fructose-specific phosphotransferase system IIC component